MLPSTQLNPGWPRAYAPGRVRVDEAAPREQTRARSKTLSMLLLAAYVFFLPMQLPSGIANFAPSDVFLILWLCVEAVRLKPQRKAWSPWHFALIGVFWLGTWISVFNFGGFTTYLVVKNIGLAIVFLGYLFVSSTVRSWEDIRFVARVFILATSVHCVIALAGYFAKIQSVYLNYSPDPYSTAADRVSGMLLDPNAFGGLVMVALVLQGFTFVSERPLWKGIPGILIAGLLAFSLLLTLSRSAWIAFGFALMVLALFRPRLVIVFAVLAVAGTAVAYVLAGRTGEHVAAVADRPRTTQQRVDQIIAALPIIQQNPLFGTGLGGFDQAVRNDPSVPHPYVIHNTTVWILTEFGLVGVTAFFGVLGWTIRAGKLAMRGADKSDAALIIALICAEVGMFGLSTGIEGFYQRHWWMVLALIASAYAISRSRLEPAAVPTTGRKFRR